ncbi:protein MAIN-LIKE 1-like [Phaseolus vulgaris]|uniref:protein MAIN-LIKE 1-like n=1 Tax=Phaseolus vulgaris TaxID=3885 RepID=UPI0035CC2860
MSLLRLQDKHVTKDVWEGNERLLRPRRHAIWILKHEDILDQRVKQLIDHSGFGHLLKFKNIDFNHVLLTALVERWRSETHTFHFPLGETTVTLEDVELILGLPVDGQAVTGITNGDLELPHHATDDVIAQHARAHILTLIGSLLMPDSSGSKCWAWERLTCISPQLQPLTDEEVQQGVGFPLGKRWTRRMHRTHTGGTTVPQIRAMFDGIKAKEFLWTPYRVDYVRRLITIEVSPIARAVVPLICFATVEFHQVDRVMRQFGFRQSIPHDPFNLDQLHKEDMRGRTYRYWPQYHVAWIAMWNDRHNCLIQGNQFNGNGHLHDKSTYMQWDQPHMSFHQPPFNYSTSPSQQQFFVGPSNPFATSTMIPPSAYNPMSSMQYYRPIMPSQVSENQNDDNEVEGTDDDIPPPPPPTLPSEQQPQQRPRRQRRGPPCGTASHK